MNDLVKKLRVMSMDKMSINVALHQVVSNATKTIINLFQKSSNYINQSPLFKGISIECFLDSEVNEQDREKIINTLKVFIEETK